MALESRVTQTNLNLESIVLFVSDMAAARSFYEDALGLRTLELSPHVATYSAGHVQIRLLPADEHNVELRDGQDRSIDITFMVDDFLSCREALVERGVQFSRTLEYSIGMTADFYDPDGHWFSLYQPSEAAMGWPSGPKLEALASDLPKRNSRVDLADAFIAYVFLFFSDPDVASDFYGGVLELEAIEGGPCRRIATRAPIGVVKYDVGSTMLTTHHVETDDKRFRVSTVGTSGVALAFQVPHLTTAVSALTDRGVVFSGCPYESPIGRVAQFTDPVGHVLSLCESTDVDNGVVRTGMSSNAAAENWRPATR